MLMQQWQQEIDGDARQVDNTEIAEDLLIEQYQTLRKNKNIEGQAHHLNQDAIFRDVIARKLGVSIKLAGNIMVDTNSPHYNAHVIMEDFLDQYRIGGELYGEKPTIAEYNVTLYNSLIGAGLSVKQATIAVQVAMEQQRQYGLSENSLIPRIPKRINMRKNNV